MPILPGALDDPHRRARLRGGVILERHPLELPIVARGVAIGLLLALVVAGLGWPLAAATPLEFELVLLGRLELADDSPVRGVAVALSHAGHLTPVAATAVIAALLARWRWGGWDLGLLLLTVLGGASAVTGAVKLVTARPRPAGVMVETLNSAFPSGHAVRAAAMYGLAAWLGMLAVRHGWQRILLALLAAGAVVLNAVARVALAAHWPSDVLAGVAVGLVWLTVSMYLLRPRTLARARRRADADG